MMITIAFIAIVVFSRLVPHAPNVSPLVAASLFAGAYLNKKIGWIIPLGMYIISDLIIGLHNTVIFTWSSAVLIYFIGVWMSSRKTVFAAIGCSLVSSLVFFVVTNFGVWLMGWYPRTAEGLTQCFIAAIPFFRASLLADLAYVAVMFGTYEYFVSRKRVLVRQQA